MNPIAKAIRANELRRSRFHTERGQLMPVQAWLRVPSATWDRLSRSADAVPWIVPAAIAHLEKMLQSDWDVLELGSGQSTAWYSTRTGHVLSIEHDPAWHDRVAQQIRVRGITNCTLELVPLGDTTKRIAQLPDATYDLVVVDSDETATDGRIEFLLACVDKVRPSGYVLLDDSDRHAYRGVDALLVGWNVRRFVGIKPFPLMAVETSIYQRPGSQ